MSSPPTMATFGVEEEFFLVDAHTGALSDRAPAVLARLDGRTARLVCHEFNLCQVEINSPVATTLDGLDADLGELRRSVARAAVEEGCRLAATGTHPFSSWQDQHIDVGVPRYERMLDRYQLVARQQVICGCHVHVGLGARAVDLAVMNRILPWLPVLLALSANSPFYEGTDSGYGSYRDEVWRRWPTAGYPPAIHAEAELHGIVEELQAAAAVTDGTQVYWYVRPSFRHPTLEMRICDTFLRVDDVLTVAGLIRGLAWSLSGEAVASRPWSRELLDAATWLAARYAVSGDLIDPVERVRRPAVDVVEHMLDTARIGLDHHGDTARVEAGLGRLLARGPGAAEQRRVHADTGDLAAVVAHVVETTVSSPQRS